jgi:crotonobetainyl-CoA:carnitine CoA-transferase CaiB-like acyl-CoA transferase
MREPDLLPIQVADIAGGALPAALQICAALVGRNKTGKGCFIDVSMTHSIFGLLASSYARVSSAGERIEAGKDMLVGRVPCYGVYKTKDGHISVGSLEPKFWQGLCAALAMPELRDRAMDEGEAGDDVRRILTARFVTKTNDEWQQFFASHDVCVEAVRTPEQALSDTEFATVNVDIEGKHVKFPVPAIGIAGSAPSSTRAPHLGEHNDEVLGALPAST